MKLANEELLQIKAGATLSATMINAVVKGIDIVLDIGRSLGTAIRRLGDHKTCPY